MSTRSVKGRGCTIDRQRTELGKLSSVETCATPWRVLAYLAGALSVALPGCTPIAAVHGSAGRDRAGAAGSDAARGDGGVAGAAIAIGAGPCAVEDAHACAATERASPLACKGSTWVSLAMCGAAERCETAAGPTLGTCVAIAGGCLAHPPGEDFCDGDFLRSCVDLVPGAPRSCGEQRRCNDKSGKAECVCAPGSIDDGSGAGCQVPSTCTIAQGGCDPITSCTLSAGQRVCSICPGGYTGSGENGCVPTLSALTVTGAQLSPAFSPDVHSYRIELGLLTQQLIATPVGPAGVRFEFDGVASPAGSAWQSPILPLGERTIALSLISDFGVHSEYDLTVERTGIQEAYLKASRPDSGDQFGFSLALWGDTLVVGASGEDSAAAGVNGNQSDNAAADSGAAYVFVRTGTSWSQQAYLKSDAPTADDYFGTSIAIWGDTIAVGAAGANPLGSTTPHGGSVHVFVREAGRWSHQARLAPADTGVQDMFGTSLALQNDRLAVGAPLESSGARYSGAVYIFERTATTWGAPSKIKASAPNASGLLGWSLALDGDTVVAGAPEYDAFRALEVGPGSAYVLLHRDSGWSEQQRLQSAGNADPGATFGWSVALAANTIAVGAPWARASMAMTTQPGAVYVFGQTAGAWQVTQTLQAALPRRADWYGWDVALSSSLLLVAAAGDGSGARGLSGDSSRTDASGAGALYLYGRQADDWTSAAYVKAGNADGGDHFGIGVALYGDSAAVSAPSEASASQGANGDDMNNSLSGSGAVYVFR